MNRFESIKKPLMWLMPLLLAALVTGCGSSSSSGSADTTAPTVTSTTPANGATAVSINSKITAAFSEAMNPATLNATTFTVATSAVPAVPVAGTMALDETGKIAVFTHAVNFAASSPYIATITTGAKDKAGNAMAAAKTWSFTTGTTADTTLPTVISTSPADLATGVGINTDVTATFSEAMNPSTLNDATFTLKQGYSPVAGTITYLDGLNGKATFHPTSNLTPNTTYIAAVTTGAMDLAGNTTSTPGDIKKWSFTTGSGNVVVVPPPVLPANPAVVNLGTAANYAILAKASVTTVPSSVVTGNVGLSPAAASYLYGWSQTANGAPITYSTSAQVLSPGKLYASDYTGGTTANDLTTAVINMQSAYTDAAGRTATSAATTDVGAGTLTSLTLTRGVYQWGSAITIPTDLTLNGSATDVWIFKVAGTLDMAAAKNVILTGGALPKNVFWQVSGTVNIGANTHFSGIILGQTIITLGNLSSIDGRLLAQTDVNIDATTVTQPAP